MEEQLWNVFRETGDPMGYLLYKAEEKKKESDAERKTPPPEGIPPASL